MSSTTQSFRINASVVEQSIARDAEGRWILTAVAGNGFQWQVDATEAVTAAAVQHRGEEVAALTGRIQEMETELDRARDWIAYYARRDPGG